MKSQNILLNICIATIFLCVANHSFAQQKIGHFDINYVLPQLPEYKKADTDLQTFTKLLREELENKQKEFEKKMAEYKEKASSWSNAILESKQRELQSLENQIKEFSEKAENDIQGQQAKLLQPIYEKIEKTMKEVALANTYTHIMRTDGTYIAPKANDISDLVLKKLGITPAPVSNNKK